VYRYSSRMSTVAAAAEAVLEEHQPMRRARGARGSRGGSVGDDGGLGAASMREKEGRRPTVAGVDVSKPPRVLR
jgi:hypothetical protein